MTATDNATDDATHSSKRVSGRYGSFAIDGEVLVYDRENTERWVQSDTAVGLGEMR